MIIKTETNPSLLPTLSDVKISIGILDDDSQDDYISGLIETAQEMLEDYLGFPITIATKRIEFPNHTIFEIPKTPKTVLKELTIQYYNKQDAVASTSNFTIDDTNPINTTIALNEELEVSISKVNPISIQYKESIRKGLRNKSIRQAMIILVAELFKNSGMTTNEGVNYLPLTVRNLLRGVTELWR